MRTIRNYRMLRLSLTILILLTLACGAFSAPVVESESTVTVVKSATPTSSIAPTTTFTETLSPAQAALTEYARQAEGTRQVLGITEVALKQSVDATATARALDATASILAPLPSVDGTITLIAPGVGSEPGTWSFQIKNLK